MRFVGIDLHKINSQICVLDDVTGELIERRVPTSAATYKEFFQGWAPTRILIESATESEWVARVLEELGHEVIVADPNFAPMYATLDKKVKTDKRDARALMEACKLGAYRKAHRVSDEQHRVRHQLMVRSVLVRSRTKMINAARSLLRQDGYRVPSGDAASFHIRVKEMTLGKEVRQILTPLLGSIEKLTNQIETCDDGIAQLGKGDTARRLQTVPGVGPVISVAFISTLDNVERFPTAREVASYLGLVPSESSSGEKQHRGGITKRGNSQMRSLLIQAAHGILRRRAPMTEALHVWGNGIAMRKGKGVAVVALARRLCRILYALWRDGAEYSPAALSRPQDQAA